MVQYVIIPLIGLTIALFGVFFDAKSKPKSIGTITLVVLLILTACLTGWSSWDNNKKSEEAKNQAIEDKNILRDTLLNISNQLSNVGSGVTSIAEYFGIQKDNRSNEVLAKSMKADEALSRLSTLKSKQTNKKVTVQYFPKDIDRDLVQSALVTALLKEGFSIKTGVGNPSLTHSKTNSIWYGSSVPDESVRIVALALTRAGVTIRGIQPHSFPNKPSMKNLIQIGSWVKVRNNPPISVEQIITMQIKR